MLTLEMAYLMYSMGHTDTVGTVWKGTTPGCEHQETELTGGPSWRLGTTKAMMQSLYFIPEGLG